MTERPRVSPAVVAAVADLLPLRLRRRIDEQPDLAETWQWSVSSEGIDVVASSEARVTVRAPSGVVASIDQATCTCLLAPRCLHLAAVLLRLPLDDAIPAPAEPSVSSDVSQAVVELDAAQRGAVEQAWQAASALLESGAQGAGLVQVGELLRAVHSCRVVGLPRLSSAGLRVAQDLRNLQEQRPEFRLEALAADFQELLGISRRLRGQSSADAEWIGSARRTYAAVGSLRVAGVFSEAIVSAAGYAGVATYVADQNSVLWSLSDVAPGTADRCLEAYAAPVDIGDASFDHRSLGRAGLHLHHATAADNRRLGAGRSVSAVSADGRAWTDQPLAALWAVPLDAQLDRAWSARDRPFDERRAGDDLLFVRGVVAGARNDALELEVGKVRLSGIAPSQHAELAYQHNLRLLASAPGLPLLVVGRVAFSRPRTLFLLAVGAVGGSDVEAEGSLNLPPAWGGRVNLGLDYLQGAYVQRPEAVVARSRSASADGAAPDPLDPLRQRLQQVLLGGRSAISQTTWSGVARDEATLMRNHMQTAAQLLRALKAAPAGAGQAVSAGQAVPATQVAATGQAVPATQVAPTGQAVPATQVAATGRAVPATQAASAGQSSPAADFASLSSRERLAFAWLAGRTYIAAAGARLQRLSWLSGG